MPRARRFRRRRPALVGAALSWRLHLLWLARSPASGLVGVRGLAQAARSPRPRLRRPPALRPRRAIARDDRLLGQRDAGRRGALAPPAYHVVHQWYLLRRRAPGGRGAEGRGSAAVAHDGGA